MTDVTSDAIPPALTEDQWADAFRVVPGTNGTGYVISEGGEWCCTIRGATVGGVSIEVPYDGDADIGPRHIPALIALANAALPENDPHKLTREDVGVIGDAAETIAQEYGITEPNDRDFPRMAAKVRALNALAARVAALLPPE